MNVSTNKSNFYGAIVTYGSIAAIPVMITGCIINIFVYFIISHNSCFRKTTYYLIRVTVTSDIVATSTGIIAFIIISIVDVNYTLGSYLCRILFYIILTSYSISIFTLCIIGIDRYFLIIKPFSSFYRKYKTKFLVLLESFAIAVSVTVCIPSAMYNDVYPEDPRVCDFTDVTVSKKVYLICIDFIIYFLPTGILLYTYGSIITHQNSYIRPGNIIQHYRKDEQIKRKKFTQVLITITASYLLTTWPFFITGLVIAFTGKSLRKLGNENIVYFILGFASFSTTNAIAVVNPFLYLKFDNNIKKKSLVFIQKYIWSRKTTGILQMTNRVSVITLQTKANPK